MATAKDCNTLTSYYAKLYRAKYGHAPVVNAHKARWAFDSLLITLSVAEAKELLDFYMTYQSNNQHALDWFFYHYEEVQETKIRADEDAKARARLRAESAARAAKWGAERGHVGGVQFGRKEE